MDDLEEQWNKKVFGDDVAKRLRAYVGEPIAKEAAAEIERLRSIAFGAEEEAQTVRKTTIEECARVAESLELLADNRVIDIQRYIRQQIAAAMRALKCKNI